MASRIIAVFGATGNQGGSVVRELLKSPAKWKVVGLTRNPSSDKAKKLASQGVDVVECDADKLDSVKQALKVTSI